MPILKADNLAFGFGPGDLFAGLSFELRRGDFTCVLGPNGCGKSTLLRLLTGRLSPRAGRVSLKGGAPAALEPAALARLVAFVPSEQETPYDFTVRETVLLGRLSRAGLWRGYTSEDTAAADRAMEETGVTALAGRSVNTLSTGERQLTFIAQALAQEAPILLLDEPTSHLDLRYKGQVMGLLANLARAGMAVAAVLHEPGLARLGCGKALLLGPGGERSPLPAAEALRPERLARLYGLPAGAPVLAGF